MENLFIDIETYSSVDLKTCGLYKYVESPDFEILLISYAIDDGDIVTVDLTIEGMPDELEEALFDTNVKKHAHNAAFERVCLRRIGYDIEAEYWYCSAVHAAYCGLPMSLADVSKKLDIGNKKLDTGTLLIKYFSCPCKPTLANGHRTRNMPWHSPAKWAQYKEYNKVDVAAERDIYNILKKYPIPAIERDLYVADQHINDVGVFINSKLAKNAIIINDSFSKVLSKKVSELTGILNPNSVGQIKDWFLKNTGEYIESLNKEALQVLVNKYADNFLASLILEARGQLGKSSIKKYNAMLSSMLSNGRACGLFQFYGAGRTGRWAGRLIQLQNLAKNKMRELDMARQFVLANDQEALEMLFGNVSQVLSELIRTAFIPKEGNIYYVADYSAIEARVLSWLADEQWRLDVFFGDGRIYEESAVRMFNVPIEAVTKTSDLRFKAKTAELALGYQGSLGAMTRMGGEAMGLSPTEMKSIVKKWRAANPNVVALWDEFDSCAIESVMYKTSIVSSCKGIVFSCDGTYMTIKLPSGHTLYYRDPSITTNKFGKASVSYYGIDQEKKIWCKIDTYGGKLTENIVQAVSRDILGQALINLKENKFTVVMHIHDEVVVEGPNVATPEIVLERICDIMSEPIYWAPGLPLNAEGFSTYYYKKD